MGEIVCHQMKTRHYRLSAFVAGGRFEKQNRAIRSHRNQTTEGVHQAQFRYDTKPTSPMSASMPVVGGIMDVPVKGGIGR